MTINHIGLITPDVFGAIDWYGDVFGLRLIMGPRVLDVATAPETRKIYGKSFEKAYQAHLLGPDGVGVELFQFVEPPRTRAGRTHESGWGGFSHVCFTVADLDETVARVLATGGSEITPPATFVDGRPWRLSYCSDPWGASIELMSQTYAEAFANWPQPGMERPPRMLGRDGRERSEATSKLDCGGSPRSGESSVG